MKKILIFSVLMLLTMISLASAIITDEMIAYWDFEQVGVVNDVFNGTYNLTLDGSAAITSFGKIEDGGLVGNTTNTEFNFYRFSICC